MTNPVDVVLLKQIVDQEYHIPDGVDAVALLPGLMINLGSNDSDLRDNSLEVLWSWLIDDCYDDATMRVIALKMAENITVGLGEECSDTVFLRAFSALILGVLVDIDQNRVTAIKQALFTRDEILGWLSLSIELITKEKDLRGYVPEKGWAHCPAHTGDLLTSFARHPFLEKKELQEILIALQSRFLATTGHIFVHNEDERLAAVVIQILQRELVPLEFFSSWLEKFANPSDEFTWRDAFTNLMRNSARVNAKNFLRAIYFFLVFGYKDEPAHHPTNIGNQLASLLLSTLKQIYPNSRYGNYIS